MGSDHHFCEFSMDSLEDLSLLRELLSDVITADEYINEDSPVLLDFEPLIDHNVDSTQFLSPVLNNVNKELDVFALGLHSHQIQGVGIQDLHHIVQGGKYIILFVHIKLENLFGPILFDNSQFLVNLKLFLSDIYNLLHFRLQFVELQL